MRNLKLLLISLILATIFVLLTACVAVAQTFKIDSIKGHPDSGLFITKLPACSTACPDSARIWWMFGIVDSTSGHRTRLFTKAQLRSASDTIRIDRPPFANDSVHVMYVPYLPPKAVIRSVVVSHAPVDTIYEFYNVDTGKMLGSAVTITEYADSVGRYLHIETRCVARSANGARRPITCP